MHFLPAVYEGRAASRETLQRDTGAGRLGYNGKAWNHEWGTDSIWLPGPGPSLLFQLITHHSHNQTHWATLLSCIVWDDSLLSWGLQVTTSFYLVKVLSFAGTSPSPFPVSPWQNSTCQTRPQRAKCLFHSTRLLRSYFPWGLSDFLHAFNSSSPLLPLKDSHWVPPRW